MQAEDLFWYAVDIIARPVPQIAADEGAKHLVRRTRLAPNEQRGSAEGYHTPVDAEEPTRGQSWPEDADTPPDTAEDLSASGWVTTDVAARAVRVSPRTIRRLIDRGELKAKAEGEGVERRWLVSVDSLHALRASRTAEDTGLRSDREGVHEDLNADSIADVLRELSARLELRTAEAVEMRTRLELTERAQSTTEEEARRLREENERLREELAAERSKGFWRRLFGG